MTWPKTNFAKVHFLLALPQNFLVRQKCKILKSTLSESPASLSRSYLLHPSYPNPSFPAKLTTCSLLFLSLCTYYSLCLDSLLSSLCLQSSHLSFKVHLKGHLLWEDFPDMPVSPPPPSKIWLSLLQPHSIYIIIVYLSISTSWIP